MNAKKRSYSYALSGIITGRTVKKWQPVSLFSIVALFSFTVLALTAFYMFFLNVKLSPSYFTITIDGNGINNKMDETDSEEINKEFQKQWFRMQKARIDWEGMLVPCGFINTVKNKTSIGWGEVNKTSPGKSVVEYTEIRPAGQFSRVFIRSRTEDGRDKVIGGDFWMVVFTGPANVTATVFDHNNGSYEAIALLVDPGYYTIIAVMERTLCNGYVEPEPWFYPFFMKVWYIKHHPQTEKFPDQPPWPNYVYGRINNTKIIIHIVQKQHDLQKRLQSVLHYQPCSTNCRFIWTGLGRWIGEEWKPYLKSEDRSANLLLKKVERYSRSSDETMFILGDSTNKMFAAEYFYRIKAFCGTPQHLIRCHSRQQIIFPFDDEKAPNPKEVMFSKRYGNIGSTERWKLNIFLDPIRKAFSTHGMNNSRSLFVMHYNTHVPKYITFAQFRKLMVEIISMLKNREKLFGSKAQVLWKTMTGLGHTETYRPYLGKYHSAFRVRLFAAYALSQVCKEGFDIYDVYSMSASTFSGARDRVHFYDMTVFPKAMDAITRWFLSESKDKTMDICFKP